MKLFSFQKKEQGYKLNTAVVSCGYTLADYGNGQKFRSFTMAFLLPTPFFGEYLDTDCIFRGWRIPVLTVSFGFALAKLTNPTFFYRVDHISIWRNKLISTREQREDEQDAIKNLKLQGSGK